MALDKTALKNALLAAFDAGSDGDKDALAVAMSDAIDSFVKTGTVATVVTTPDTINGTGSGSVT